MSPNLPRYHELVSKQEEKKNVPGPGKYQIKSQFSAKQTAHKEVYDLQTVPFGATTKRFPPTKSIAPSPGSYDDPRTAFESSKRYCTSEVPTYCQLVVWHAYIHSVCELGTV